MKSKTLILALITIMLVGVGKTYAKETTPPANVPHWFIFFDYDLSCRNDLDGLTMKVIVDGTGELEQPVYEVTTYSSCVSRHYWHPIVDGKVTVYVYDGKVRAKTVVFVTAPLPGGDLYMTVKTPCEEVPQELDFR